MLLVVFGAGASHDAIHPSVESVAEQDRLPLTNDLFAAGSSSRTILQDLPLATDIVHRMREAVAAGNSVESALSSLVERSETPRVRQDLVAVRFFIRQLIAKQSETIASVAMTNQRSLLRQVDEAAEG